MPDQQPGSSQVLAISPEQTPFSGVSGIAGDHANCFLGRRVPLYPILIPLQESTRRRRSMPSRNAIQLWEYSAADRPGTCDPPGHCTPRHPCTVRLQNLCFERVPKGHCLDAGKSKVGSHNLAVLPRIGYGTPKCVSKTRIGPKAPRLSECLGDLAHIDAVDVGATETLYRPSTQLQALERN